MYAVRCPHCMRLLKLTGPVEDAKLKCRGCGKIFVGSTTLYPDQGPPPAEVLGPAGTGPVPLQATSRVPVRIPLQPPEEIPLQEIPMQAPMAAAPVGAAAPAPLRFPVRKKSSPIPLIITAIGVVAIVVVAIVAVHFNSHRRITVYNEKGQLVSDGYQTNDEAARLRERAKLSPVQAADKQVLDEEKAILDKEAKSPRPAGRPAPTEETDINPDNPAPKSTKPPKSPDASPNQGDANMEPLPEVDANIAVRITGSPVSSDENPDSGYITGVMESKYDCPLTKVPIDVYTHDPSGNRRAPIHAEIPFVPPFATIRFSVTYNGIKADQIKDVRVAGHKPEKAPPNIVAWMVDKVDRSPGSRDTVVFKGQAANPLAEVVRSVQIYYDFYDGEGNRIGVTKASKLDNGERIGGKSSELFTITYDPGDYDGLAGNLVKEAAIRVWATKSGVKDE